MSGVYELGEDAESDDRCPDCGGDCIVGECLAELGRCGYCDDPECVQGSVCGGDDDE